MLIDSIVVGERVRKDLGDIESLAASIKRHGLLHPVVIKTDNTLVAGHRRIEAARINGWKEIPATIIDVEDLLSAERDENTERKDFTPTEAVEIGRLIEAQHKIKIAASRSEMAKKGTAVREAKKLPTGINGDVGNFPDSLGRSHTVAAAAVGMSPSSYDRSKAVVSAAEADPETFGDLPQRMDETGNVHGTFTEMKRRQGELMVGRKPRHPIHAHTPYPRPNRELERAMHALAGICLCLEQLKVEQLDATKTKNWAKALKKSASTINHVARRIENVQD